MAPKCLLHPRAVSIPRLGGELFGNWRLAHLDEAASGESALRGSAAETPPLQRQHTRKMRVPQRGRKEVERDPRPRPFECPGSNGGLRKWSGLSFRGVLTFSRGRDWPLRGGLRVNSAKRRQRPANLRDAQAPFREGAIWGAGLWPFGDSWPRFEAGR